MKNLIIFSLFFLVRCIPSFHEGKLPNEVKFNEEEFNIVLDFLVQNDVTEITFDDTYLSGLPTKISLLISKIGFQHYQRINQYHVFTCGSGVVGRSWGFIHGDFSEDDLKKSPNINIGDSGLMITFFKKVGNKWYQFGTGS